MLKMNTYQPTASALRKRLMQIYWVLLSSIVASTLLQYPFEDKFILTVLVMAFLAGSLSYYFIRKGELAVASHILILIPSVILTVFMWLYGGLRDEVIVAFPAALTFALVFGQQRFFFSLSAFFIVNFLLIGYLNDLGIIENTPLPSNLNSGALISVLCLLSISATYIIVKDLKSTLFSLQKENQENINGREKIEELLYYDTLTKLPNRNSLPLFRDSFNANKNKTDFSAFVFDIDDFKNVNDILGQKEADNYLKKFAALIDKNIQPNENLFRLSGDLFLLTSFSCQTQKQCEDRAIAIKELASTAINLKDNQPIICSVTIGINHSFSLEEKLESFVLNAEYAMHVAKENDKGGYRFYDPAMDEVAKSKLSLISDLQLALQENQFELHFQPKWHFKHQKPLSAEALIRWHHPTLGLVPPLTFIPMAEKTGQIVAIGEWVIKNAIAQAVKWRDANIDVCIAVNVSALQLKRKGFTPWLIKEIERAGLPSSSIEVEFTESLLIGQNDAIENNLDALHVAGIRMAIDDFGTGYSNLGYLQNLKIDVLKIDKTFIDRLTQVESDQAIVKSIIQMAKILGMTTVAEGVESESTAEILEALGCDIGQGYLWSKPLNADEFYQWYRRLSV